VSSDQWPGSWGDKLTIETPEQTALDFPLAGVGSRCLAFVLDSLIQIVIGLVLLVIGSLLIGAAPSIIASLGTWIEAVLVFAAFAIYYAYFALFEALWNGQTPGKRWIHIRVIHDSGRPISVPQALARNLLRIVDQLPGMYGVGLITALISKENRRVGDYVAGTIVVHERPLEGPNASWVATAGVSGDHVPTGLLGTVRLTREEILLIEAFLQRRDSLDYLVRGRMAHQVAERFVARLHLTPEQRSAAGCGADETLLETLAQEARRSHSG
jgi:uncharacterized RDD family membrane protein YckC